MCCFCTGSSRPFFYCALVSFRRKVGEDLLGITHTDTHICKRITKDRLERHQGSASPSQNSGLTANDKKLKYLSYESHILTDKLIPHLDLIVSGIVVLFLRIPVRVLYFKNSFLVKLSTLSLDEFWLQEYLRICGRILL